MIRIWSVYTGLLIICAVIITRLFYWMIIQGPKLRIEAESQYFHQIPIPAQRGTILAQDGSPLVINQAAGLVYAQPKEIKDTLGFIKQVAPILEIDEASLSAQLTLPNRVWIPLARKVDMARVAQLQDLQLDGLGIEKESKRFYPEASMAAHILGFVGSDQNGEDKGYFGIEGYYDRELHGKDGVIQMEKDVRGAPILFGDSHRVEPENGRTLVLWLDRTVQHIVEQKLKDGIEKYGAVEGSVIMLDPKTGGVLAAATFPKYDPGAYRDFDNALFKNPLVASAYEPGSTFKTLVMSAGIQEGVITPDTTMDETGPVPVGPYLIRTWNNQYRGLVTMTEVLQHSSNVGMVFIARKLGQNKLIQYIRNFGFGERTNVDLEEETPAEIREDTDWKEIDMATASFGQGIAITPLQMVRAVAAIANNGWLMEPHMVKEIRDSRNRSITIPDRRIRQVIMPDTAKAVTDMMVHAVDQGEAKWAKPKGYQIAGKTGTAQIPVAGHYDETKTIASFVGFAPAYNPKFVMLVTLREPTSSPWGSETAAPLFFAIAKEVLSHYNIPPTSN